MCTVWHRLRQFEHLWRTQAGSTYTPDVPDLVSTDDAVREFDIGKSSLYRWLRQGLLERYRRRGDRRTFVDREQLKRLIEPQPQRREPKS